MANDSRPRDLYDVINLFRHGDFREAGNAIRDVVQRKCTFKNVPFPSFEALAVFRDELFAEWGNMLGHQLPALPPAESFWEALPEFFNWLVGSRMPAVIPPYPLAAGDQVLRMPAGAFRMLGRSTPFIEVVRFAAANHLCVDLPVWLPGIAGNLLLACAAASFSFAAAAIVSRHQPSLADIGTFTFFILLYSIPHVFFGFAYVRNRRG